MGPTVVARRSAAGRVLGQIGRETSTSFTRDPARDLAVA